MNKVAKIVFWITVVGCLCLIFFINYQKDKEEYEVINKIIDTVLTSNEANLVYVAPSKCEECSLQTYQMKFLVDKYELKYYYINLKNLSSSHIKKVFSKLNLEENTTSPTLGIYKDNKLETSLTGINSINKLYNMLNEYGLLNDNKLPINYLNITTYTEKIEEDRVLLAVGSYKDDYSNQVEEILWDLTSTYNIDLNFIHLVDLSQTEGKLFESKIYNFEDSSVVVPSLLLIENHNIVDMVSGIAEESEYVEFFQRNGIIE